ncbi:sarcospan-like isoform X2 [Oncorhynchus masou masou]|uniref:sarcospan-like isoform X2 n=1 Tax=Oncorhynchus masou masou TaxID=90313 RepID=UPI00318343A6
MNGMTMGFRIWSRYLCAFTLPSLNAIVFVVHSLCLTITNPTTTIGYSVHKVDISKPLSHTTPYTLSAICSVQWKPGFIREEHTSPACQWPSKLLYFILCTVGLVLSVLVMAFSGHHYAQTNGFSCLEVGDDCMCTLDPHDPIARTFTYAGVSDCGEVTGTLKLYFLLQIALNLTQALVCALGAFVMWKHRYQVFFVGLQIGSPSFQHWQKV